MKMSILLLTVSLILFWYLLPEILRLKNTIIWKHVPQLYFVPYILRAHFKIKKKSFFYVKMLKAEPCEFDWSVFVF